MVFKSSLKPLLTLSVSHALLVSSTPCPSTPQATGAHLLLTWFIWTCITFPLILGKATYTGWCLLMTAPPSRQSSFLEPSQRPLPSVSNTRLGQKANRTIAEHSISLLSEAN